MAVPVAIVGTFAAMAMFGFSLNNLTLFGLVLAIGIVVDDAIVVVEAVEHHIEQGLSPRDATLQAMQQVSGPVIAVRPGAQRGVRALRVHQRHHRAVLPAVRADDLRLDDHLGVQLADAQPGADGAAAAAARLSKPVGVAALAGVRAGRRLAGLGALADYARRVAVREHAGRRIAAVGRGCDRRRRGGLLVSWPVNKVLRRRVLARSIAAFDACIGLIYLARRQAAARQRAGADRLRRTAGR